MVLFITNHFIQNKFSFKERNFFLKKDEEFTLVKNSDSFKSAWIEDFILKFSISFNVWINFQQMTLCLDERISYKSLESAILTVSIEYISGTCLPLYQSF